MDLQLHSLLFLLSHSDILFEPVEWVFLPGGNNTQCFIIAIVDDNALENAEMFTWFLSSTDEGILISNDSLTIEIQDDDSKK